MRYINLPTCFDKNQGCVRKSNSQVNYIYQIKIKIKEQTTRTKHDDLKTKGNKHKEKENLKRM